MRGGLLLGAERSGKAICQKHCMKHYALCNVNKECIVLWQIYEFCSGNYWLNMAFEREGYAKKLSADKSRICALLH